ncbi:Mov34/MPN/PAD-1 family protein [Granulicella arctica]|uniref:Mov34/MPN/PAD-1 family protein n=1 Tax=Granulicella arctica TaxID=940613 RepID=UPI0021E0DDE9|nr:Mov34/MPN/PAD-1 family protein [Granulicella arctica]
MTTPAVQISAEVTRQIRQHARSSMTTEVCGVLIGDLLPGSETDTTIFAAIAAVNATQAGTHVTFTQDAWEHIYKVKDADYPEARIVGWYHSHPGFGVFLSEHDTFIQENFFSAPNQVAWVFDPHTDEEGCFGWINGSIARLTALTITDSQPPANVSESRELTSSSDPDLQDADPDETPTKKSRMRIGHPPRWLRWTASISALAAALLVGFTVSHILFPAIYPLILPMNPMTGQPLIHDPKTGDAVYIDPRTQRYLTLDLHSGKLTPIDPEALKAAQPAPTDNPFPQQPQPAPMTPAPSPQDTPREKK